MEKTVVLLSGGMDSTALLHYVRKQMGVPEVHTLTFCYGQKHSREVEMAAWQAQAAGAARSLTIDMGFFRDLTAGASALTSPSVPVPNLADIPEAERQQPATYVPNRNMVLLSLAGSYAEANGIRDIFYGAQAQDEYGYWDCTVDFVRRINHLLALNRRRSVRICAPFAGKSKGEVLRVGLASGVDYSHTWTCYRGETVPCRGCPSCVEREKAFQAAGIKDPLTGD